MSDSFSSFSRSLTSPADAAALITPSDSTPLTGVSRALYVGVGGDAQVVLAGGDTISLTGLLGGVIYPLRVAQVMSTGTSASGLVALY